MCVMTIDISSHKFWTDRWRVGVFLLVMPMKSQVFC